MKFKSSHKILAVIQAFLVLLSTVSITIDKHFCGDKLIDVAVFSEVESCASQSCNLDSETFSNGCCKLIVDIIEGQDVFKKEASDDDSSEHTSVSFYVNHTFDKTDLKLLKTQVVPFKGYIPPILTKDISVCNQVFLI